MSTRSDHHQSSFESDGSSPHPPSQDQAPTHSHTVQQEPTTTPTLRDTMAIQFPTPTITVLYFAAASSATSLSSESVPLPSGKPLPLSDLAAVLVERHRESSLGEVLRTSQWSVDAEMVDEERVGEVLLKGGEEVAVICPVSGG